MRKLDKGPHEVVVGALWIPTSKLHVGGFDSKQHADDPEK